MSVTRALLMTAIATAPALVFALGPVTNYGTGADVLIDDGSPETGFPDSGFPDSGFPDSGQTCSSNGGGTECAADGGPGCAGAGGGGGTGGRGGGAAIALFVAGKSDVTMTHGAFFTGFGGNGGNGGTGGSGGAAMQGTTAAPVPCGSACGVVNQVCQPVGTPLEGGAGGTATNGGPGGQGGGGAGGPTYFYVIEGDAAAVLVTPDTLPASAFKGAPGTGGLPNGHDGGQAEHLP